MFLRMLLCSHDVLGGGGVSEGRSLLIEAGHCVCVCVRVCEGGESYGRRAVCVFKVLNIRCLLLRPFGEKKTFFFILNGGKKIIFILKDINIMHPYYLFLLTKKILYEIQKYN